MSQNSLVSPLNMGPSSWKSSQATSPACPARPFWTDLMVHPPRLKTPPNFHSTQAAPWPSPLGAAQSRKRKKKKKQSRQQILNFFLTETRRIGWAKLHHKTWIQTHDLAIHLPDPQNEGSDPERETLSTSDNILPSDWQRPCFPGWENSLTSTNHDSFDKRVRRGAASLYFLLEMPHPALPSPPHPQSPAGLLGWWSNKDELQA